MNDPKIVYYDGTTHPMWRYTNYTLMVTHKNVNFSTEFQKDDLVLKNDGIIRIVRENSYGKKLAKEIPSIMYNDEVRDDMRFCVKCLKLVPEKLIGKNLNDNSPNSYCNNCADRQYISQNNPNCKVAQRRAFIDKRRLEIIRKTGCVHPGCVTNTIIEKYSDKELLSMFDFNHKSGDRGINDHGVSKHKYFTTKRAKTLNFNTWEDLWEAEAEKCEVLCKPHHTIFGLNHTKSKRQKRT